MADMAEIIVAKSDQINAADLIGAPRTIKIAGVTVRAGEDQPVSIRIEGDKKVYRPCKSMSRVLVRAWGPDSTRYVGRSMTLYHDPDVLWAGMKVGGIRISHMSDLSGVLSMALAENRMNRKIFTVKPLKASATPVRPPAAHLPPSAHGDDLNEPAGAGAPANEDATAVWVERAISKIDAAETATDLEAFLMGIGEHTKRLEAARPELWQRLQSAADGKRARLDMGAPVFDGEVA
jgi:hypothetical protein